MLDEDDDDDDDIDDDDERMDRYVAHLAAWKALQSHMPMERSDESSGEDEVEEDDLASDAADDDSDSDTNSDTNSDTDDFEGDASAWEKLVEEIEHAGRDADNLSPLTMAALRAYALKISENLSAKTFAKLPNAFPRDCRMSWKRMHTVAESVSGFKPEKYDMCEDSCVLFAGPYAHLRKCPKPKCGKDRYDASGRPMKQFTYLPLIPHPVFEGLPCAPGDRSEATLPRPGAHPSGRRSVRHL
jgi:hypothetical protein